jgi:hypothetical protein
LIRKIINRLYLQLLVGGLIYLNCVCFRIVVSDTYCVVFLLCLSSLCIPCFACFSRLSIFLLHLRYSLTFIRTSFLCRNHNEHHLFHAIKLKVDVCLILFLFFLMKIEKFWKIWMNGYLTRPDSDFYLMLVLRYLKWFLHKNDVLFVFTSSCL